LENGMEWGESKRKYSRVVIESKDAKGSFGGWTSMDRRVEWWAQMGAEKHKLPETKMHSEYRSRCTANSFEKEEGKGDEGEGKGGCKQKKWQKRKSGSLTL